MLCFRDTRQVSDEQYLDNGLLPKRDKLSGFEFVEIGRQEIGEEGCVLEGRAEFEL